MSADCCLAHKERAIHLSTTLFYATSRMYVCMYVHVEVEFGLRPVRKTLIPQRLRQSGVGSRGQFLKRSWHLRKSWRLRSIAPTL
jgi:hypothetical protein